MMSVTRATWGVLKWCPFTATLRRPDWYSFRVASSHKKSTGISQFLSTKAR